MIYNKEPILVLWDLVKSESTTIPIYKNVMNEDEDSIPDSYMLLSTATGGGDNARVFGDGSTKIRSSSCQITLISKGSHQNSTDTHNVNKDIIKGLLDTDGIDYNLVNLGFNGTNTETVFTSNIKYVG